MIGYKMIESTLISDELTEKYAQDAIDAAWSLKFPLNDGGDFFKKFNRLLMFFHRDLQKISEDESGILLESIAIKNCALLIRHLNLHYPHHLYRWYKDDIQYGENTYPLLVDNNVLFPKALIETQIRTGKKNHVLRGLSEIVPEVS